MLFDFLNFIMYKYWQLFSSYWLAHYQLCRQSIRGGKVSFFYALNLMITLKEEHSDKACINEKRVSTM
jgi:hypothetical protein